MFHFHVVCEALTYCGEDVATGALRRFYFTTLLHGQTPSAQRVSINVVVADCLALASGETLRLVSHAVDEQIRATCFCTPIRVVFACLYFLESATLGSWVNGETLQEGLVRVATFL